MGEAEAEYPVEKVAVAVEEEVDVAVDVAVDVEVAVGVEVADAPMGSRLTCTLRPCPCTAGWEARRTRRPTPALDGEGRGLPLRAKRVPGGHSLPFLSNTAGGCSPSIPTPTVTFTCRRTKPIKVEPEDVPDNGPDRREESNAASMLVAASRPGMRPAFGPDILLLPAASLSISTATPPACCVNVRLSPAHARAGSL